MSYSSQSKLTYPVPGTDIVGKANEKLAVKGGDVLTGWE